MIITLKDSHPPQTFTQGLLRTQHCTRRLSPISLPRLPVRMDNRGSWEPPLESPGLPGTLITSPYPSVAWREPPHHSRRKSIFSVAGSTGCGWSKGHPRDEGARLPVSVLLGWEEKRPPPVEQRASTSGIFHLIPKTVLRVDLILFHHFKDEKREGDQI